MLSLIIKRITDVIKNRPAIFLFFMFTLIVVSFSSLFLMNRIAQIFFRDSLMRTDYYIEFNEPQDRDAILEAMRKSVLFPSTIYYIDETSCRYNTVGHEPAESPEGIKYFVAIGGHQLNEGEEPGIYGEENRSVYVTNQADTLYGRTINRTDAGRNNAVISYHLNNMVTDGKITAEGTEFEVVGCATTFPALAKNSIAVHGETFGKNGYKAKIITCLFEIPPFRSSLSAFEQHFSVRRSSIETTDYFGFGTILRMIKSGGLYLAILVVVLTGVTGIINCWVLSGKRTYAIYQFCGMTRRMKRAAICVEMLLYTLFSGTVGTCLFFLLQSTDYKHYIYDPHPALVAANFVFLYFVCCVSVFIQDRKNEKHPVIYDI